MNDWVQVVIYTLVLFVIVVLMLLYIVKVS